MSGGYTKPIGKECQFLIPRRRDRRLSDGEPHTPMVLAWWRKQLWEKFGLRRWSGAPEFADWRDDSGRRVFDRSVKFTIAIPEDKVDELRQLLMEACVVFRQECIYLRVGGDAELVYAPPGTWPQLASQ
jgi:hypothetical protein